MKNTGVEIKDVLRLHEVLEKIVGSKHKRFGDYVSAMNDGDKAPETESPFIEITQPEQQIALLAEGIHGFFDSIDAQDVGFNVSVATIINSKPAEWFYTAPATFEPKASFDVLKSPDSTISKCLKRKGIVIVEDLRKESKKQDRSFVPVDEDDMEDRSMICYPVNHQHSNTVPYVISIVADQKNYFSKKKRHLYIWALKKFCLRMSLEHSLLVIKGRLNNEPVN